MRGPHNNAWNLTRRPRRLPTRRARLMLKHYCGTARTITRG